LTFLFPHFLLILFNPDFRTIVTCTYLQLGSWSLLFYHFPFWWNARHKTWHRRSFRSARRESLETESAQSLCHLRKIQYTKGHISSGVDGELELSWRIVKGSWLQLADSWRVVGKCDAFTHAFTIKVSRPDFTLHSQLG